MLAYLQRLAAGRLIHLISFEKAGDWARVAERESIAAEVANAGIVWHPLRYHKRSSALATAWDIARGFASRLWLELRYRLRNLLLPWICYFRTARPAAVMANMWPLTVIAVVARIFARARSRLVVVEHTCWSRSPLAADWRSAWAIRLSMHFLLPRANHVVTVSRGAADDLANFARIARTKVSWVHNPLIRANGSNQLDLPVEFQDWYYGDHKRLISVGALKAVKDHATLLSAFDIVRKSRNVRLLILGEGECRSALQRQIHELGLQNLVFMPGIVLQPGAYMRRADLHVLSSTCEGFGNVIVEALDAGTLVVSTDCPSGPREILQDGKYGRLVPVGDIAAMAAAIESSLASTHDAAALKARAREFSIELAVDKYEALLFSKASSPCP